jgi:hypothetical protein
MFNNSFEEGEDDSEGVDSDVSPTSHKSLKEVSLFSHFNN